MTNIQSAAVTAEAEGPLVPAGLPTEPQKAKPAWRSLNFGPRMWISLGIIGFVAALAFIGPLFYPFGPEEKVGSLYDSPSAEHILGTENFGYDVLAVLMASARNSIIIGLLAGTIAVLIGVGIGILAGYVGGWVEELLMGFTNIVLAIPSIVILILISISLQSTGVPFLKGVVGLALVIGVTSWPWTARAVRAQASSVATREHIDVAKLSGARTPSIMVRDVLPYLASYAVMAWVLQLASAILAESTLSMLGLGPSGANSLGKQLFWALAFQAVATGAWWAFLPPTIVLTMISFGLLYLQSSLDEVFNPRLRRGKKKNLAKAAARREETARKLAENKPVAVHA
ncbi:MAG TPA: ABC transporter permease [Propionicimonas sp.]|jgi:peptide/nickel transport system permease protein|uniref:ABC transporter permease n=1 Tax=Propionicimonas sp. TaxID=1955623 RepID=UPI002F42A526